MCEEIGVTFRLQSDLSPMSVSNAHLTHFEHVPFITFPQYPEKFICTGMEIFQRILDILRRYISPVANNVSNSNPH